MQVIHFQDSALLSDQDNPIIKLSPCIYLLRLHYYIAKWNIYRTWFM